MQAEFVADRKRQQKPQSHSRAISQIRAATEKYNNLGEQSCAALVGHLPLLCKSQRGSCKDVVKIYHLN